MGLSSSAQLPRPGQLKSNETTQQDGHGNGGSVLEYRKFGKRHIEGIITGNSRAGRGHCGAVNQMKKGQGKQRTAQGKLLHRNRSDRSAQTARSNSEND